MTGLWRGFLLSIALLAVTPQALAEQTRFAVVDLDPKPDNDKVRLEVEREVARLRAGAAVIEDASMRQLLATGEGPAEAAQRALKDAQKLSSAGNCQAATKRASEAELMILTALSIDEEREPLKALYTMQVICEAKLGRAAELALAARRLRSLVAMAPTDLPADLWEKHVNGATAPAGTVELLVDSDPANATVAINLHGEGVTPRTLKVAPGPVHVEIQKEGYKKAFRTVLVKDRPARAVMRLIPRAQDRTELAEAQLRVLRRADLKNETAALSRLSQLVRVETLVLMRVISKRISISFFDAERGALTEAPIESAFDPATGKVEALSARGSAAPTGAAAPAAAPTVAPAAAVPTALPPGAPPVEAKQKEPGIPPIVATGDAGLPEARAAKQEAQYVQRKKKPGAPWWSWVIAGAIGAGFMAFMWSDRPTTAETVKVRASWPAPPP